MYVTEHSEPAIHHARKMQISWKHRQSLLTHSRHTVMYAPFIQYILVFMYKIMFVMLVIPHQKNLGAYINVLKHVKHNNINFS